MREDKIVPEPEYIFFASATFERFRIKIKSCSFIIILVSFVFNNQSRRSLEEM